MVKRWTTSQVHDRAVPEKRPGAEDVPAVVPMTRRHGLTARRRERQTGRLEIHHRRWSRLVLHAGFWFDDGPTIEVRTICDLRVVRITGESPPSTDD